MLNRGIGKPTAPQVEEFVNQCFISLVTAFIGLGRNNKKPFVFILQRSRKSKSSVLLFWGGSSGGSESLLQHSLGARGNGDSTLRWGGLCRQQAPHRGCFRPLAELLVWEGIDSSCLWLFTQKRIQPRREKEAVELGLGVGDEGQRGRLLTTGLPEANRVEHRVTKQPSREHLRWGY